MRTFVASLAVVLGGCASQSGAVKDRFAAIAELEDRRAPGNLAQLATTGDDAGLRARAFLALGRLQEPSSAAVIVKGLADADSRVRVEAAFAAGLLGQSWVPLPVDAKTLLTNALLEREAVETDVAARDVMLEAMGRVATPALIERLVDRLATAPARAGLALGVAQYSKAVLPERAFGVLIELTAKSQPDDVRFGATYALVISKNAAARSALLVALEDASPEVRALAAKGLGDIGNEADVPVLRAHLDDGDYRVAVEATRALAKAAVRCETKVCAANDALGELNGRVQQLARGEVAAGAQPLLTLAQSELPSHATSLLTMLRAQLRGVKASDRRDIANLDCRFAYALDRLAGSMTETKTCGLELVDESRRLQLGLQALIDSKSRPEAEKLVPQVLAFADSRDARVNMAAVELLGNLDTTASREKLRSLLISKDLILAVAAASSLAHLNDTTQIPAIRQLGQRVVSYADVAPAIADALAILDAKEALPDLREWLHSPHHVVRTAAADAITKIEGAPLFAKNVEYSESNLSRLPLVPKGTKLSVTTVKGVFEVTLYTDDAPLTSANIAALAKRGFFNNLTFHRVVPDFVAQGGDPRGDGNGGPGYTIRCEINHKPYKRYAVGMALSGRDTGGSQFFVTTSPQPRLDSRYTSFGEVTSGQGVIDQLLEGDVINDVRVIEAR